MVKVDACGVCGTDLHIVEGTSRSTPPVVLGHEYAGVVSDTSPDVAAFRPGQRVAVDPNISCGTCFYCRRGLVHLCENLRALGVDIDGGMAEYCAVPEKQLHLLDDRLPGEAAPFIEPVSCAIHGIDRSGIRTGDVVSIIGGGTIGLIMLQLARNAGASRVIVVEPIPAKREIARKLGAAQALDSSTQDIREAILDLTGVGADVVIECVGKIETTELALDLARRGGVVEIFGVCPIGKSARVQPNSVYFKELSIVGSYINPYTFSRSIEVLASGSVRVDAFQAESFPLDAVHDALDALRNGETLKSIIKPGA